MESDTSSTDNTELDSNLDSDVGEVEPDTLLVKSFQSFGDVAKNAKFTFNLPMPSSSPRAGQKRTRSSSPEVPSGSLSPPHKRQSVEMEREEEIFTDVDDDGIKQGTLFAFYKKETKEETQARLRKEAERDAEARIDKLAEYEQKRLEEQERIKENNRIRSKRYRERVKAKKEADAVASGKSTEGHNNKVS
jgi:hypothetical protein